MLTVVRGAGAYCIKSCPTADLLETVSSISAVGESIEYNFTGIGCIDQAPNPGPGGCQAASGRVFPPPHAAVAQW